MGTDVDVLVRAAQDGDAGAREQLVADHLPLLYNVVGWALGGHADVDDVVQESVLRALGGLGGLREPARFRSWLVSIAMNQVRRRWSAQRAGTPMDPQAMAQVAGAEDDFAGLAVLRLELSEQRREIAEATRWLDAGERELLGLWWLEASGHLTRRELADGLGVPAAHAAVRVQRMKKQLATCRAVVRVVSGRRCGGLEPVLAEWDGRPSPLWRKRIAKHIRDCRSCTARQRDLAPPEALLAGLVMVPMPADSSLHAALAGAQSLLDAANTAAGVGNAAPGASTTGSGAGSASSGAGASSAGAGHSSSAAAVKSSGGAARWVAGAAAAGVAAAVVYWALPEPDGPARPAPDAAAPAPVRRTAPSTPPPTPEAAPDKARVTPRRAPATVEQRVVTLVNAERAAAGCRPLRVSPALHRAAQRHSADMASHRVLDHRGSGGDGPWERITAAGFRWNAWAENIARGQSGPPAVVDTWMGSPGHRANILNCGFTMVGIGLVQGSGGPWWTQVFATPR
ncbi:sigma-70 family RNA polymerase sigma factor [Actinomadura sp. NAK00032]|uniref:sigma-70 family RNA polymerase sigma factor n=1 Tax=Actinomadura sp. NAK00032 TaxID=2742128 RepID=UPI001C377251|nr:sigma-70 family RNA polymerase sigma factor [Actinomadura sp. NAK00032]